MSTSAKPSNAAVTGPAQESLISRIILTPTLFISFLLSLFLIDHKTHGGIFGNRPDRDGYYHSHQKKLAKQEMEDAFLMRNKVIAGICVCSGVGLGLLGWLVTKGWQLIAHS